MGADELRATTPLEERLAASRAEFLGFVRSRIADPELAEDVLQSALLRAMQSADSLRDADRVVPWFYRILRNAIVDAYRRRAVQRERSVSLEDVDLPEVPDEASETVLCACFEPLIDTLKPEYAEVLRLVDLGREAPGAAAERLGITANNLKVRRHRARAALREQIEQTCRICSDHGCLDCTCAAS